MSGRRPKHPPDRFSPPLPKLPRRGRPSKKVHDDDDDEAPPLQTQLPLTPPRPDPPAPVPRRASTSQKPPRSTPKKTSTPLTTPNETAPEVEEAEKVEVPEVNEKEEQTFAVVRVKDANVVLNQYYYDIIDMEQHCVLFERNARTERWNVLQVRRCGYGCGTCIAVVPEHSHFFDWFC
jgi:hypothetical protein